MKRRRGKWNTALNSPRQSNSPIIDITKDNANEIGSAIFTINYENVEPDSYKTIIPDNVALSLNGTS